MEVTTMENKKEFNPKITFKFIENIWQERDHRESEAGIKAIYKGEALPHSFTEMMFSKALKAYEIIRDGKDISEEKVIEILSIYKPETVIKSGSEASIAPIVEEIKKALEHDTNWRDRFLKIFRMSVMNPLFKDYEVEMAKILSNYALICNGLPPIIMYCYSSESMARIIRYGGTDQELGKTLSLLTKRTNRFNRSHEVIPLSEVQKGLCIIQDDLISDYGIKHLSIFGSYARGEQDKYSDLDVVCEVRKDFRSIANLREKIALKIKGAVGMDVDVMIDDLTYDSNQIPVDMFSEKLNQF
jgi:predicted nucleotidyltransferase